MHNYICDGEVSDVAEREMCRRPPIRRIIPEEAINNRRTASRGLGVSQLLLWTATRVSIQKGTTVVGRVSIVE